MCTWNIIMSDHGEQTSTDCASLISQLREEIECNEKTIEELMDQLSKYESSTLQCNESLPRPKVNTDTNVQFMTEYEEMMHKYHLLVKENKQLQRKNETLRYELGLIRMEGNEKENFPEAVQHTYKTELFVYPEREKVLHALLDPWK